jgi:hypothetical protein
VDCQISESGRRGRANNLSTCNMTTRCTGEWSETFEWGLPRQMFQIKRVVNTGYHLNLYDACESSLLKLAVNEPKIACSVLLHSLVYHIAAKKWWKHLAYRITMKHIWR